MSVGGAGARVHADVVVGAALLVFSGVVLWRTTSFAEVPAMLSQNVPPTFFPRLVLGVLAALSLALVVRGARREPEPRESVPGRTFVTGAILAAAVALVSRLGMLATIALVSVALPICWGERRALRIALLAVSLPLGIYAIFVLALGMRFPAGLLP